MHKKKFFDYFKIFIAFILFINCINVASATENSPLLKLLYNKINDEIFSVDVIISDIPKFTAASITIGFNKDVVQVCSKHNNSFIQVPDGAISVDDVNNNDSGIEFDKNFLEGLTPWDGEVLFNKFYPFVNNSDGLVKTMILRMAGDKECIGQMKLFTLYFKFIGQGKPEIKIADENSEVYDYTNPKGATFADAKKEFTSEIVYEGSVFSDKIEKKESEKDNNHSKYVPLEKDDKVLDKESESEILFSDIDNVPWAKEAIYGLVKKGIINGRGNGIFDPDSKITRAEFAKMLLLALGKDIDVDITSDFRDVSTSAWYAPYVSKAYESGIINGYSKDWFGPEDNVKRQDVCLMLYRAFFAEEKTQSEIYFEDADLVSDYAFEAVCCLYEKQIISGKDNNKFAPIDGTTRAEAAKLIYYCYQK